MIFISYAKEDADYAQALYKALRERQLDPWMDKPPEPYQYDGLTIGQKWETVLRQKLAEAAKIILVLSDNSIRKRGYVQNEFRIALERMNHLPDNDILVLPLLVHQCEVPALSVGNISLTQLQWEVVPKESLADFAKHLSELA